MVREPACPIAPDKSATPRYDAARPNHTEMPNISPHTNESAQHAQAALVERTMVAYERLMQLLVLEEGHDFGDVGITMAQAKVLLVLAGGSMHMSELVARLRVTPSTTSGLVEKLVEQGLVSRADDPADRRQVIVSTTAQGVELLERFRELNSRQLRVLLATLPATDLEIVERSLIILRDATARRRAAAGLPSIPTDTTVGIDQGSPQ